MCGINGIFAYHYAANAVDSRELERSRDHMQARGPDGAGTWLSPDERIGLAHRRLAIIDLSPAGAQPMASANGKLVVTFNGEIYNYQQLRLQLEARGHVFNSHSDTEVLLQLYIERGESMVDALRGMFAFAIWDSERKVLFLARDPYGIKPLYYADDGWTFRFASQVKALLAGGAISRDPEPAGTIGFYLWGSVPEPFTTCQAIRALPAGCTMRIDRLGAGEPQRYHSIAKVYRDAEERNHPADAGAAVSAIHPKTLPTPSTRASPVPPSAILDENYEFSLNTLQYCIINHLDNRLPQAELDQKPLGYGEDCLPRLFSPPGPPIPCPDRATHHAGGRKYPRPAR